MEPISALVTMVGAKLATLATGAVAGAGLSSPLVPAATSSGLGTAAALATGLTAAGTVYGGLRARAMGRYQAKALKAKAAEEKAIAQREASKRRHEKTQLLSRVRAVSAASGGAVTDPTVTQIMANIEREGEYNALAEMYRGQSNYATLRAEAKVARSEGNAALASSLMDAGSTIYSGIARRKRFRDYQDDYG